jgi:hypothetical protein
MVLNWSRLASQSILSNNLVSAMQTVFHSGVALDAPNNLVNTFQGRTILPGPSQIDTRLTPSSLPIPGNTFAWHFGRSLPGSPGKANILHFCRRWGYGIRGAGFIGQQG